MTSEPSSRDLIRASNPEREAILEILHDALEQGRIAPDEFAERSEAALAARTLGDLRVLVADLPLDVMRTGGSAALDLTPIAADGSDVVEWRGSMSSLKRKGAWQVPRRIMLHRRLSSVELDFTEALFTSQVVDIELDVAGGSVEMRVPDGASVSMDEVTVVGGSIEDHRRNQIANGRPHIRVTGSLRWGSLEVRGPRRKLFG
jgi:hypothetical protein